MVAFRRDFADLVHLHDRLAIFGSASGEFIPTKEMINRIQAKKTGQEKEQWTICDNGISCNSTNNSSSNNNHKTLLGIVRHKTLPW